VTHRTSLLLIVAVNIVLSLRIDFLYNSILYSSYGIQSIGYQDAQWQLIIVVSYFQITHYGEAMCHRTTGRHEHVIIYFVGIHINPTNFRKFVKLMTAIYYLLASKQK